MALATKPPAPQPTTSRRVWKAPLTKTWWYWLLGSVVLYGVVFAWYFSATRPPNDQIGPADPSATGRTLLSIGIIAFLMILGVAAFSLRSRFMRSLPGKAQDWLWMHTWLGIVAIFVVFLHENFDHFLRAFPFPLVTCFKDSYMGVASFYALMLLVATGIIGRLLDIWQAHTIARDAGTNGTGIVRALKERILEVEYVVERLSAGKSEPFKLYCIQAIDSGSDAGPSRVNTLTKMLRLKEPPLPPFPTLMPQEHADFQRAHQALTDHSRLVQSLRKQQRARLVMRAWRYIHITIAVFMLAIIVYHVGMEVLSHLLNVIPPQQNVCS
ncbi:MAG TPA: ferric reductase-like transmembrane domain-containing protein [Ktedonobacteraceae bacterium]|nr:ferric reductase-like transmembrane domain-containing protein [Ktedonobacteraceae bacterium]